MALSKIHIEYFLERKRNCVLGTGGSYLLSMSQVLCCLRAKDNFDCECPAEMGLPTSSPCIHRIHIRQTFNYSGSKPVFPKETTEINETLYFMD